MGGRSWGRRSRTSRRRRMGEVAGARVIYPRRSWSPPQLVSGLNCGHCPPFYNQPSKLYNCCQITQNICCPEITMRHQAIKCFVPSVKNLLLGFFFYQSTDTTKSQPPIPRTGFWISVRACDREWSDRPPVWRRGQTCRPLLQVNRPADVDVI